MSNTLGKVISLTVFGESHGACIGGVIDGLPAGLPVDEKYIEKAMDKRRSAAALSTARREGDKPEFVSGVIDGHTEGSPVAFIIKNEDSKSADYDKLKGVERPGHADYAAEIKYGGYQDARGGGHFSGRLTAVTVAAGAIVRQALEAKGIVIGTHIKDLNGILDADPKYPLDNEKLAAELAELNAKDFAVISGEAAEQMQERIKEARAEKDSVGGVLETYVTGIPAGTGEPLFDSVESELAKALFSVGGVKGVEFGAGFEIAHMKGSEANDAFRMEAGKVVTESNNNGGINGGIANGMPIVFRTAVKPTPSIGKKQQSVNFETSSDTELKIEGRHDPAIVHRAAAVVDSITALVLADLICQNKGNGWLL